MIVQEQRHQIDFQQNIDQIEVTTVDAPQSKTETSGVFQLESASVLVN